MRNIFIGLPRAVKVLIVAAVYFCLAIGSLEYSYHFSNATPIWPPSGFAFAVLLLAGRFVAPGIFIGAFSANLFVFLTNHTCPPLTAGWASVIMGAGNTAEALTGYYLLHKLLPSATPGEIFKKVHAVLRFAYTAFIMCFTSCAIGATAILLAGIIPLQDYFMVGFTWWTGDVSGVLLLTPFIVLCATGWRHLLPPIAKMPETIFLTGSLVVVAMMVFLRWFHPPFLFTRSFIIVPFLIWASVRLNRTLVTVLLLISSVIAVVGTVIGVGPFISPILNESLLTVEAFVSINSIMILVLNAAISERKENEKHLEEAKNSLEEIVHQRTLQLEEKNSELESRNKELASFTYAASHDLQEPLRKIQTFSDKILQTSPGLPQNTQDLFRRIQSSVLRMKLLIENLLSYSRVEVSKPVFELTDLAAVLQEVKNDLLENIRNTSAVIDCPELPKLVVVPFQIQQLFDNIISNAIKFRKKDTPPQIVIEYAVVKGKNMPLFKTDLEKKYCYLCISDNGIGFDQQYAEKIFDIFQRLHGQSEYEGTGIGLAICKKIVETHKGFIHATGESGKGASFHIFLPFDEKENSFSDLKNKAESLF
jgi:signal transduction histidine kinase